MTSFKTPETAVAVSNPETAVVPREDNGSGFKVGAVSGPVRRTDFKLPSLNLVYGTGVLQENFEPGSIVLNKEVVLTDGEKPVILTVLSFRKYFLEKPEKYDPDVMPRLFKTEEELAAAGLHTNWVDDTPPPAIEAGEALVAIETTDTENPHFPFNFGDKNYALAIWRMNSASAYNRAGKLILTASEWNLKTGLQNGSWSLTTKKEKLGKNFVVVPVLKAGPRNSKDLAEFFASLI